MLQFRKQPIVAIPAEPIAQSKPPTQVELAGGYLALAEAALATARSKYDEATRQLATLKALPPTATLAEQVAVESQRNGLQAARESLSREVKDAMGLVELRKSEWESTCERAKAARSQLQSRQKLLDERRTLFVRLQTARPALEAIIDDSTWRVAPSVYTSAQSILQTISSLGQDVSIYAEAVTKLQAEVAFWGDV